MIAIVAKVGALRRSLTVAALLAAKEQSRDRLGAIRVLLKRSTILFRIAGAAVGLAALLGWGPVQAAPVISEFMASNQHTLADADGDYADWIEIYNPDPVAVDLSGYYLTDTPNRLTNWAFPAGTVLGAGRYLIVFASGKSPGPAGELHASFRLDGAGEYLALVASDGRTILQAFAPAFPPQYADWSYSVAGYMAIPTPGGSNRGAFSDPAARVTISPASRAFTASITVTLHSSNAQAAIRYTLNGAEPGVTSLVYTNPLTLTNTAQVRARAFLPGEEGTPASWASYIRLGADVRAFTSALPVIVLENFGAGTIPDKRFEGQAPRDGSGIRQVPRQPAFMALFDPAGAAGGVLTNAPTLATRIGIRVHGSSSALQPQGKENYSIESWGAADHETLPIRPFGWPAEPDWMLHAPYQYDRALIRNALVYELMRRMGHYAARTRFVQVFVHTDGGPLTMSDFSGVDVFMESIKKDDNRVSLADLAADGSTGGWMVQINRMDPLPEDGSNLPPYNFHTAGPNRIKEGPYGGSSSTDRGGDDIPVGYNNFINFTEPAGYESTPAQRGAIAAWFDQMEDALYGVNYRHPTLGFRRYLDVPSFIDHFIMVNLTRNVDGLQLSTYLYKPDTDAKLHLDPVWDYDRSIDSYDSRDDSVAGLWGANFLWFPRLFADLEFNQAYIDRWQELRRGPLATTNLNTRIDALAAEITAPVAAANFARWNAAENTPRPGGWPAEIQYLKTWLASRTAWIDSQYLAAPIFSQPGGPVTNGLSLTLRATNATIYYTTDGSDPRLAELVGSDTVLLDQGAPAQALIPRAELGEAWKGGQEPFDSAGWLAGVTGVGFGYPGLVGLDVVAMAGVNASVCVRMPFVLTNQVKLEDINRLLLSVKFDDGFVAYLNGVQVASSNAPQPLRYNSFASASRPNTEAVIFKAFDLTAQAKLLRPGANMLAFHALNRTADGTDLLLLPRLVASTGRPGGLSPIALRYTNSLVVTQTQVITARSFGNGRWSGPVSAAFQVGAEDLGDPAAALALSELMYHPPAAGSVDGEEFEFVELQNTGTRALDLGGLWFGSGITFAFTNGTRLAPGGFFVLARNAAAFAARYPGAPLNGLYTGHLSNAGDTLALALPNGSNIFSLVFSDRAPWPTSADGQGDSLQRHPVSGGGNQASNWVAALPSPGRAFDTDGDGLPDGWELAHGLNPDLPDAAADADGDGPNNLEEYLAGTDPQDSANFFGLTITPETGAIRLAFFAAAGRAYRIESCEDPASGPWALYTSFAPAAIGQVREVSLAADGKQRFYRVVLQTPP
jgi:hypothetical protein